MAGTRIDSDYLTKAEVQVLITLALEPVRKDNAEKFELLFAAMNQLSGSVRTASWIIGVMLAVVGIVLGLKH